MLQTTKAPGALAPTLNPHLKEYTPFGGNAQTQITTDQALNTSGLYTPVGLYNRANNTIHVHVGKTAYGKTSEADIAAVKERAGSFAGELERAYPGVRISRDYTMPEAKAVDLIRDPVKSGQINPSGTAMNASGTAIDRSRSEYISGQYRLAGYLLGDNVEHPRIIVGIRDFPEGTEGDGKEIPRLKQVAGYFIRDLRNTYPHHEIIDTTKGMTTNVYVGGFLAEQKF